MYDIKKKKKRIKKQTNKQKHSRFKFHAVSPPYPKTLRTTPTHATPLKFDSLWWKGMQYG